MNTNKNDILMSSIDELDIHSRTKSALRYANILTIGDLIKRSESDIKALPNIGLTAFNKIKYCLEQLNLSFSKSNILPIIPINKKENTTYTSNNYLLLEILDNLIYIKNLLINFDKKFGD